MSEHCSWRVARDIQATSSAAHAFYLVSAVSQVDPTLTRADRLVGQVLGQVGQLPDVYNELEINFFLLRRLLGVRTSVRIWQ